jgi:hypothetical protein
MKKVKVGVNAMRMRMKRLGYRGGGQDHMMVIPCQCRKDKALPVLLTNQCLGKKRMLSAEREAEESFLSDVQRLTYSIER